MSETRINNAYSARELREGEEPLDLSNPPSGGSAAMPSPGWHTIVVPRPKPVVHHICSSVRNAGCSVAVYFAFSDIPPGEWAGAGGGWWLKIGEYSTVIKYCPYCGEKLEAPERVAEEEL